jgi:hypothetical protein
MTIRLNPSNLTQTRSDLGLGDAATKTVGVANGNVIAADATGIPAINGSQVTALNATNLATGTVATARMGSGTASSSTFLRGDGSWAAAGGGAYELVGSVAGGGSSTSVTITGLTTAFETYLLVGSDIRWDNPSVGNQFHMTLQFGSSSGIVTSSVYKTQLIIQDVGSSFNATSTTNAANIKLGAGNAPEFSSFALNLYSSQSNLRPGVAGTIYQENTSVNSCDITLFYGGLNTTGSDMDITQLKFACTNASAVMQTGRISVYRLKHT